MIEPEPPVTEPTPAPEIFVDGYASGAIAGGVAKFTFFSIAHDPATGQYERRIVLRLIAPLPVVAGVQEAFEQLLGQAQVEVEPAETAGAVAN